MANIRPYRKTDKYNVQRVCLQTIKDDMVFEGLNRIRNKVMYTDVAFNLVPEKFTLPDLQKVYEVILGKPLYKANFREKIEGNVKELDEKGKTITTKRMSRLYEYKA